MSGTPKTISASGRCFVFPITEGDAGMTTINCSRSFADSRLITTNGIKYKKTWILSKSLTTQCSTMENSCHVNHKSFKECPDKDDHGGTAQSVYISVHIWWQYLLHQTKMCCVYFLVEGPCEWGHRNTYQWHTEKICHYPAPGLNIISSCPQPSKSEHSLSQFSQNLIVSGLIKP